MNFLGTGWTVTIIALFLMTFGLVGCVKILLHIFLFLLGGLAVIYLTLKSDEERPNKRGLLINPLENVHAVPYLFNTPSDVKEFNKAERVNIPITGHPEVDQFFYELSDVIIEDYVSSWFSVISSDGDFLKAIRHYSMCFAVEISTRVQSADWLYHITGKVIEDIACHLRLFRGAGGGVTSTIIRQPRRGSPAHSPARSMPHHRRNKSDTDVASYSGQKYSVGATKAYCNMNMTNTSLEQKFFELEYEIEKKLKSRESISTDSTKRTLILSEISQMILFLTLDSIELKCNATTAMLRSIFTKMFESILDYIVDPDVLNSILLKMTCRESLSTESFLTVLRTTDNIDELKSTLSLVHQEIHNMVSKDSKGECDIGVKQQLSSLQYLTRLLTNRTSLLTPTPPTLESTVLFTKLPMGFLLDNHLALCNFLDFAHSMNAHPYIFCHLSIEAWKAAAVKHLAEMKKNGSKNIEDKSEAKTQIRMAASTIYNQYFSKDCHNRLDIPSGVLESFFTNMNIALDERCLNWFNDIEECIYFKLESVEYAFRNSTQYVRLLAELDLEGMVSLRNNDQRLTTSSNNIASKDSYKYTSDSQLNNSSSNFTDIQIPMTSSDIEQVNQLPSTNSDINKSQQDMQCRLEVVIVETGLMQERGKTYGVYALEVKKWDLSTGKQYCWRVYRRYSDFHELYATIKEAYPELGKLEFPSKKTFHNTSRTVLERRMAALSSWLSALATLGSPGGPPHYAPLHLYLLPFLNPRGPQDRQQTTTINTLLVQPLRQGMRTLRNVPEQLSSTVDDIMGGLYKLINSNKNSTNAVSQVNRPSVPIAFDIDGNIDTDELPLRVVLLLLDEVFELRCKNRWLQSQIAAILRQILTTMFSNVLNRKIIDLISTVTSPSSVIYCLDNIKRAYSAESKSGNVSRDARDSSAKSRARVAAKTVLLSCRQEELKHLIGSQTTQKGLMTVFELFQNQTLNTRLIFVLIEGLLKVLYQDKNVNVVIERLLNSSR